MSAQQQPNRQPPSKTEQFLQGASKAPGGETLAAPIRWIAELIQTLVAVMIIAVGNAIKAAFSADGSHSKRRKDM